MADEYISVRETAETELEIKRSVFIGNVSPVTSAEEAEEFIRKVRARHEDARHVAFAYVLRSGGVSKYSDDGEPQGTAGMPMLEILKKNGLCDTAVTVTRYFGGILLGASGLVRAYGNACAMAIEKGGICKYGLFTKLKLNASFKDYPKAEYELRRIGARLDAPIFSGEVEVTFYIEKDKADSVISRLANMSAARIRCEKISEEYMPM